MLNNHIYSAFLYNLLPSPRSLTHTWPGAPYRGWNPTPEILWRRKTTTHIWIHSLTHSLIQQYLLKFYYTKHENTGLTKMCNCWKSYSGLITQKCLHPYVCVVREQKAYYPVYSHFLPSYHKAQSLIYSLSVVMCSALMPESFCSICSL